MNIKIFITFKTNPERLERQIEEKSIIKMYAETMPSLSLKERHFFIPLNLAQRG
ncbi:hypothetical protein CLCAR_0272 [Clostridium carboxidivorans P7]|nr:hypothetical protein CLCAR_0272 [Clostridium carboxidivorans P7]